MPSVYHWGGRSLDEAKISQAEHARVGEASCRPSDRSATPAAATWTAAAATAGTRGAAFGRAARPIPTATRAPPAPSTTTGRVHTDSAGRRASASAGAASSAASAESTATCCATGDCATWRVSHTPPSAAPAARSRSSQIWSGRAARSAPAVPATSASTSQRLVLALVAVTAGALLAARPLQICELRDLAAGAALGGVWLTLQVAQSPVAQQVAVLSALAALLAAPALALALRPAESVWTRPVVVLGAGGALVAVGMGLAALPNAAPLVPAVAAAAVQVAAAGVALRSLGLQMASPALACSAWLIFASSSDRPPQWYTLGIGLALLAVVAVWRRDRRLRQLPLTPGPVVGLELAGIAFLVGTPMVQAVTDSSLYALEAGVVGILVALWGVVTRVRRRVAAGALVVLVAVVLLLAVPLVQLLPAWGGAGVWLLLAGVGLVAVLVATMLERGRAAVRTTLGRIGEVTADWE